MFTQLVVIFSVLAVATANLRDRGYYEAKFYEWLSEHKVTVKSGEHFVQMLTNFANNDDIIETTNGQNLPYQLGHNSFSHMSLDEFKQYYNLGRPLSTNATVPSTSVHAPPADLSTLATSIDWLSKGAVTDVKDQGKCGSCWSFSTTGALEGAYFNKYSSLVSFSEQNLVDCDLTDLGCNGGIIDNAFKWTQKNGGLCTEAGYPYVSGTTQKRGTCNTACAKNTKVAPVGYTDVTKNSDSALMSALNLNPVSVAIEADQSTFQLYKSGVLTAACGTNLDHGVLAVGYGTYTDGTDYYKVKNSWGTGWGMGGYILLQRGVAQVGGQCGILAGPPSYPNL
jgi:C1A family cysteine protease